MNTQRNPREQHDSGEGKSGGSSKAPSWSDIEIRMEGYNLGCGDYPDWKKGRSSASQEG